MQQEATRRKPLIRQPAGHAVFVSRKSNLSDGKLEACPEKFLEGLTTPFAKILLVTSCTQERERPEDMVRHNLRDLRLHYCHRSDCAG